VGRQSVLNSDRPDPASHPIVLYDGVCALCNWVVTFVLARDSAATFRFAPLQGGFARTTLTRHGRDPGELKTFVLVLDPGQPTERLLDKSSAALHVLKQLPGGWKGLGHVMTLVPAPVRDAVYTTKTYHDSFDPIRAIRTKEFSYIENYATRPLLDLPWDIEESAPGKAVEPSSSALRPPLELYDLRIDPTERNNLLSGAISGEAEAVANEMALLLNDWRYKTNDVIPSEFAGTRISARYTETYLHIHRRTPTSRSALAAERGIEDEVGFRQ